MSGQVQNEAMCEKWPSSTPIKKSYFVIVAFGHFLHFVIYSLGLMTNSVLISLGRFLSVQTAAWEFKRTFALKIQHMLWMITYDKNSEAAWCLYEVSLSSHKN